MYEVINVRGHLEVFKEGMFVFSADNWTEVRDELEEVSENEENLCNHDR